MSFISEQRTRQIIDACLSLVIGVLLILFPEVGAAAFTIVAATVLYVVGVFYVVAYIWMFIIHDPALLVRGLCAIVVATLIMLYPGAFVNFVVAISSIYLIIQGIYQFCYAMDLSSIHDKYWYIDFIYSLVLFLSGLMLILSEPVFGIASVNTFMIMAGIFFIVDAVFDFILIYVLHRDFKITIAHE